MSSEWTPEVTALAEEIRERLEKLVELVHPSEGRTRILTDVVMVAARQEFDDNGHTSSAVTVLPLDQSMPDWKAYGLLSYARGLFWVDDE